MPGPSLDRIAALADYLDHPELTYPTVHVTGTNGKTTTTRTVTSIACAHNLTVGTFISPHLVSVTERLSLCGESITEEDFAQEYSRLQPLFERVDGLGADLKVTYFEALTALAYLWFADAPVGLGVFEVGMGGTWDATNLVNGDVAVICPVGLDHQAILGPTLADIAGEKAGILKEGRPAVVRQQRPEAMEVIERRAQEVGAPLLREGEAFELTSRARAVGGQAVTVRGLHDTYDDLFVPFHSEPAAHNAAAAIVACEALFDRALDPETLRKGLAAATSPGRMEVVARRPLVILDGGHNPDAAAAVAATLTEAFVWRRLHLVLAMFADKEVEQVVNILSPLVDDAFVTRTPSPRAAPVGRLSGALHQAGVAQVAELDTVAEALAAAQLVATEDDLILVTGSFYTVGDARAALARS